MKSLILLLVFFAFGCEKHPQPECPPYVGHTIEGHWETYQPRTPAWQYDIAYGRVTKSVSIGPTKVVSFGFDYTIRNDTLQLTADSTHQVTLLRYTFLLDSLIELQDISPGVSLAPLSLLIKS